MSLMGINVYFYGHRDAGFFFKSMRQWNPIMDRSGFFKSDPKPLPMNQDGLMDGRYIIIFPVKLCKERNINNLELIEDLPDYVFKNLRDNKAVVLFDHSNEPGTAQEIKWIKDKFKTKGMRSFENVLYLSQNRLLNNISYQLKCCAYDYYPIACAMHILDIIDGEWEDNLIASMTNNNKDKFILCLNGTPRNHRVYTCAMLHKFGLLDESLVSFPVPDGYRKNAGFDIQKAVSKHPEAPNNLELSLEFIANSIPFKVDDYNENDRLVFKIDLENYRRSWISLVTETAVHDGVARITEKTFKALALGHPFLMYNHPNTLYLIKELGFSDFSDVIDHRYDHIENKARRLESIFFSLIDFKINLAAGDKVFFNKLVEHSKYNINWLKTGFLNHYYSTYVAPIIQYIESRLQPS
ncbi:hypothetical protein SAMN05421644_1094 [Allochromatium warmingii]|uniref:Uncharacterized protein n=1 Tax=Allochromatium warmingii TaxID=61595 RepID=A0A1H3DIQ0_ALLWA|nr:hypothetical protein [Allochromatium warmingii]SDX66296.1 hypothetical protein SAMN05421644_1094 [Allochromatium warmingii]